MGRSRQIRVSREFEEFLDEFKRSLEEGFAYITDPEATKILARRMKKRL